MIFLSNGSARAKCLCAAYSERDSELVAALFGVTDAIVSQAIIAELEKNSRNSVVTLGGDGTPGRIELTGAQRGYIKDHATLEKANTHGHLYPIMHWRAGDPRKAGPRKSGGNEPDTPSYFYVAFCKADDQPTTFYRHMNLGLNWPIKPEWAFTLWREGADRGLVEECVVIRAAEWPDEAEAFIRAIRVERDQTAWGELLSELLKAGVIQ